MSLEPDLFGETMEERAIALIREWEPEALKFHGSGYHVAFSGGKDSIVTLDLVRRAGVKHRSVYSVTTIDPPELFRFIKKEYTDVELIFPEKSFFKLVEQKGLPTKRFRFCCALLKETAGNDRFVITGLRSEESPKRAKRPAVEACTNHHRMLLHPIKGWTTQDVWSYINKHNIPYPSLYDQPDGFKRIGCTVCPFDSNKTKSMARWPHLWKSVSRSAFKFYATHPNAQQRWLTPNDYWEWWLNGMSARPNEDQCTLFEGGSE